jgi:hypothetical protein
LPGDPQESSSGIGVGKTDGDLFVTIATAQPPPPAPAFDWKRYPKTEAFIANQVARALAGNSFVAELAERMKRETSTRFGDWVDHLVLSGQASLEHELRELGYSREGGHGALGADVFAHQGGMFPRIVVVARSGPDVREVAIKVESIADFSRAHDLGLDIVGYPLGPYRHATVPGEVTALGVVERRGYVGFEPFPGELARLGRMAPHAARDAMAAKDLWVGRRRRFPDDAEGFDATERTLARVIDLAGSRDLACHLIFEAEREYWQSRNRAARVQKARQDRLGLGWANHDHHTFRCSRQFFPRVIGIFETLGFQIRERFHAGHHAGWGAQIVDHPTSGIVIFADLDLAPEEATQDFAHEALPELDRPNTVGLWVGLHGESILEAGMHHLEAQFDFDGLRADLKTEAEIETMKPFSDFPFLRQAFTAGERWAVEPHRANRLLGRGWIDAEQHSRFLAEGAIGSHLENLQRQEGYKGFNQQAVSAIIAATDPRLHHLAN